MDSNTLNVGGPYRNRTYNLLIKSQLLCLIELTAHRICINSMKLLSYLIQCVKQNGGKWYDIKTI